MASLPESDDFPAGIYQLEDTDPVNGGYPNEATGEGMDNIPHAQLARRTRWLKTRVDQLLATVVAGTTAVAGIVRLSASVTSDAVDTAATSSAVKAANDNANTRALSARTITGAGLATGGGDLTANRAITVPDATQAEAEAGAIATKAMSPLRVAQAIAARVASGVVQAGSAILTAISGLAANGLIVRTAAGAVAARTITAGRGLAVTNGDGVAGNPVIALIDDATPVADWNLATATGIYRSAPGALNSPTDNYYLGEVIAWPGGSWVTQTAHQFTGDTENNTQSWRREYNSASSSWTAWYRIRLSEAEQALLWTPRARSVAGTGLATGGGDLSVDRQIYVAPASVAEAEAGTINTVAMTPLRVFQAIAKRIADGAVQAGSAILTAISGLAANGLIVRTAAGTAAARTITAGRGLAVTNGDGVAGNPVIALIPEDRVPRSSFACSGPSPPGPPEDIWSR